MHADSVLRAGAAERIISALSAAPDAAGGCFGMAFEEGRPATRWIARLNNLRAMVTGIAFGDQAQFARAEALRRIGGVPALMLMEDVELSLRLKTTGRVVYFGQGVRASGRRWQRALLGTLLVVGLFSGICSNGASANRMKAGITGNITGVIFDIGCRGTNRSLCLDTCP